MPITHNGHLGSNGQRLAKVSAVPEPTTKLDSNICPLSSYSVLNSSPPRHPPNLTSSHPPLTDEQWFSLRIFAALRLEGEVYRLQDEGRGEGEGQERRAVKGEGGSVEILRYCSCTSGRREGRDGDGRVEGDGLGLGLKSGVRKGQDAQR